jgi:fibronectin type 3 domain-containing protein
LLSRFGALWLLLVSCFFFSCDLFLNKPDGDLTRVIDEAVAWSNADSVNVRIGVIPGSVSLISSDSALQGQKVGYAFSVSVTENPEWAFLGWDAVREADLSSYQAGNRGLAANAAAYASIADVLDSGGNKTGAASVTAHTSEPFYLVPWCVERPKVTDHNMKGFTDRQVTNYPIQLWFNRSLDPDTVNFDTFVLSAQTNQGYSGTALQGLGFTSYYEEPEINGSIVTIRRKIRDPSLEPDFKRLNITLTLKKDAVRDTEGIYMGKSGDVTELRYGVGTENYSKRPEVLDIAGALATDGEFITGIDTYLVKDEAGTYVVYLLLDKGELDSSIDPDFTELDTIRVTEKNLSSQNERDYPYFIYSGFEDSSRYANLVDKYKIAHSNKEPYILRHEIVSRVDGEIQIAVQPTDTLGNRYTFDELEDAAEIVTVVLDTTPPGQVSIGSSYDAGAKTLTLEWTNPSALDLEEVSLAWTKDGVTQSVPGTIPQTFDAPVSLGFSPIEEGTVCDFTVTVVDTVGNKSQSHMRITVDTSDRSPPGSVTGLGVSYNGASKTISLGWTNPGDTDLQEARIAWGVKDQEQSTVVVPATPGTSGSRELILSAGDIQTTKTYAFSVLTADNAGNVSNGVTKKITLAGAPAGLTVSGAAAASITLSWNLVSGAGGYRVYRSSAAAGPYILAGTSQAPSYTIGGLSPGTRYYFKVSGLIDSVEGSHSEYIYGIPLPSAPAGIRAEALSSTSIEVSWDEVTGALEYRLYRSTAPDSGYILLAGNLTAPEHTDIGLSPGTTYYYKVSVKTSGGESDLAAYAQATTAPSAPNVPVAPTGLAVTGQTSSSITLSWNTVTGAASYKVYRSSSETGTYTQTGSPVTNTSFTNTGLFAGTTYYYKVSAVNAGGESSLSASVSGTTPGTSAITLTIDQGQGLFSQGSFTVSKAGSPQTQTVTVTGTGYSNPRWFVDGNQKATGDSITIEAADYTVGGHSLSLWVEMGGVPWSKEIDFTVTN